MCHANGCDTPCDGFMCRDHWQLVPPAMRLAIKSSTDSHAMPTAIAQAAIAEVAHKESRSKTARARRGSMHPVQLALFGDDQVLTRKNRRAGTA